LCKSKPTIIITVFEIWSIAPGGYKSRLRCQYEEDDWQVAMKKKKCLEENGHEEVRLLIKKIKIKKDQINQSEDELEED